jgi:hypothetical protein
MRFHSSVLALSVAGLAIGFLAPVPAEGASAPWRVEPDASGGKVAVSSGLDGNIRDLALACGEGVIRLRIAGLGSAEATGRFTTSEGGDFAVPLARRGDALEGNITASETASLMDGWVLGVVFTGDDEAIRARPLENYTLEGAEAAIGEVLAACGMGEVVAAARERGDAAPPQRAAKKGAGGDDQPVAPSGEDSGDDSSNDNGDDGGDDGGVPEDPGAAEDGSLGTIERVGEGEISRGLRDAAARREQELEQQQQPQGEGAAPEEGLRDIKPSQGRGD